MSALVIRDVRLFDGTSDRPVERASVTVADGRIASVVIGPVTPPPGTRVHSHLVSDLGARLYLANGVTSVRFAGNDPDDVHALAARIEAGRVPGPRVLSRGPLLDGVSPDYPALSWPLASGASTTP